MTLNFDLHLKIVFKQLIGVEFFIAQVILQFSLFDLYSLYYAQCNALYYKNTFGIAVAQPYP